MPGDGKDSKPEEESYTTELTVHVVVSHPRRSPNRAINIVGKLEKIPGVHIDIVNTERLDY